MYTGDPDLSGQSVKPRDFSFSSPRLRSQLQNLTPGWLKESGWLKKFSDYITRIFLEISYFKDQQSRLSCERSNLHLFEDLVNQDLYFRWQEMEGVVEEEIRME